jgi:phospholipid N-methyltransferase
VKTWQFLGHFLRRPSETGAIAPSSRALARLITSEADLPGARVVVELGPGTGVFTESIARQLPDGARFFALELNPQFAAMTHRRCPDVKVFCDSAVRAREYLELEGMAHCDRIICGLPWAAFGEQLQDDLLDTIVDVLSPDGRFLTFAYLQGLLLPAGRRFRSKLRSRFARVTTTRTVWRNLPPAFVYCARKAP